MISLSGEIKINWGQINWGQITINLLDSKSPVSEEINCDLTPINFLAEGANSNPSPEGQ
jgi:hypothetical protein